MITIETRSCLVCQNQFTQVYQNESNQTCCNQRTRLIKVEVFKMNNLEFMHAYQIEKLAIADMSNEQLQAFKEEKLKNIEREKIQIQAVDHTLIERGQKVKIRIKESDLQYIPPAEIQLMKIERKMEKQGKSFQEIADFKKAIKIDFDDI